MKTILRLLAFVLTFTAALSLAQSAPADVTLSSEVPLPLAGVTAVRCYDITVPTAPKLAKEVPVTSTLTTGVLAVLVVVSVPADDLPHIFISRTVKASTALPATVAVFGGESADSSTVSVTVSPGGGTGPKNHRVTVIKLN